MCVLLITQLLWLVAMGSLGSRKFVLPHQLVATTSQTDRPKSVHNRCAIKFCGGVFLLYICLLECSVDARHFVIELSQTSSFGSKKDVSLRI